MKKKVVFLGMGGTIAGKASSATDNVGYTAAQVSIADLLQGNPALQKALGQNELLSEQVAQIDSKDIEFGNWAELHARCMYWLEHPDTASIVITHGSDTIEETAYFLFRTLPESLLQATPVVLTCAMRPATSMSPDGPQNIADATVLACTQGAVGVLVICAGQVHTALDVQKISNYRLNPFVSVGFGPLALVEEGQVRFLHSPSEALAGGHAGKWKAVKQLPALPWPRVEIVFNYAGASASTVEALCASANQENSVRGLVVAGTGNGTIHYSLMDGLRKAEEQGLRVVRATRCAEGHIVDPQDTSEFAHYPHLTPIKARIALMLDLMV